MATTVIIILLAAVLLAIAVKLLFFGGKGHVREGGTTLSGTSTTGKSDELSEAPGTGSGDPDEPSLETGDPAE